MTGQWQTGVHPKLQQAHVLIENVVDMLSSAGPIPEAIQILQQAGRLLDQIAVEMPKALELAQPQALGASPIPLGFGPGQAAALAVATSAPQRDDMSSLAAKIFVASMAGNNPHLQNPGTAFEHARSFFHQEERERTNAILNSQRDRATTMVRTTQR